MSEKFQIVLYYKKRVVIGGKRSIDSVIAAKKKFANFDETEIDSILDEWNNDKTPQGREEIVSTWALVYDDENFMENVSEVEQSEGFESWDERSEEIIKQKILEK